MLSQDQVGSCVLLIRSGLAKVVRRHADGSFAWLAFRGRNDLLGEPSFFIDDHRRSAEVRALGPCEAAVAPVELFRSMVKSRNLERQLVLLVAQRQAESDLHRVERQTFPTDVRLARLVLRLLDLLHSTGVAAPAELSCLKGLPQEDLAHAVGVHRQKVNGIINEWRRNGVLGGVSNKSITVKNMSALRNYARLSVAPLRMPTGR
jgi:CRP-like cAMP-binding protein